MKKTLKTILILWLAALMLSALALTAVFAAGVSADDFADDSRVKEFQQNIRELERQQQELENDLDRVKGELYDARRQVNNLDSLMTANQNLHTATAALIAEYESQIAAKEAEIEAVSEDIAFKEAEISDTKQKFLTFIRVQYENGTPSMLEAIYDSDGLGDMLSRIEYVGSMMDYNSDLLENYTAEKIALDNVKAGYENTLAELNTAHDEKVAYDESLKEIDAELEAQRREQSALLRSIAAEEQKLQDEYDELSAAEEAESARLEKYLQELAAKSQKEYVGGKLIWPVDRSIKRISSYYGWRTYYYRGRKITDFHRGIDIPSASGTDIYAAQSGEVILASWHSSYGNYCIVDHGGGISTLYAHCTKLLVKKGQKVSQGDHIAEMGSTGQSTGPHLHFEVRVNGQHEDPIANGWLVQPK